jgi:hypothetical protein
MGQQGVSVSDLSQDSARRLLAARIKRDIDDYCLRYDDGHRSHLGASIIGHPCSRYLWYVFRWVKRESFTSRMLRLFQRGKLEEFRFIEYLSRIGFNVHELPDGAQSRVVAVHGHFGGSLDATCQLPSRYAVGEKFLCEFKTKGTGSSWQKLVEQGVIATNHQHYSQMCVYGYLYGLRFALYMVANKNDDDLHIEVIALNHGLGAELVKRAETIISSQTAPPRIAEQKTFWLCKYCPMIDICFDNAVVETNCRSCKNAHPAANGKWYCNRWQSMIPNEAAIKAACPQHEPITS